MRPVQPTDGAILLKKALATAHLVNLPGLEQREGAGGVADAGHAFASPTEVAKRVLPDPDGPPVLGRDGLAPVDPPAAEVVLGRLVGARE